MTKRFYITTPIYYVNGAPHIGHAYSSIAADVMARFKRLDGHEVFFLTGTDEHGQKLEKAARDAGLEPRALADRNAAEFRAMARTINLSNDDFIRTTEDRHKRGCAALWQALDAAGAIELGHYEGWYATRDEAFYGEDELTTGADGVKRSPYGAPVEWVREPSFFFKLSMFQDRLLALYEAHPGFIQPISSRNEVISFVRSGLRDLSISRTSFSWGVPVPGAPDHVMYVWIDALTNYLTALGYPDMTDPRMAFWPADVHLVGKEITRFHAVYWPAMLMAAGLPLPRRIFGNGWWTVEGEKMSKSLDNALPVQPLIDEFGLDPLRFFLLREMPFGNDGDFSRRALISRLNVELANDLGNLAQRILSFIAKNAGGTMPARGVATEADVSLRAIAEALPDRVRGAIDRLAFQEALEEIWKLVRASNAYIDREAPWTLRKSNPTRMVAVLRVLCEALRVIGLLLQPFMPDTMARLLDLLAVAPDARDFASLDRPLTDGAALPAPVGLFPRFIEPTA
ncbi:methionine--tRNA ligase [Acidiphilium sp. AL]|uniref:Methionine--tRNA ligase n=1 Tax=Acidiphilium iwatense TaxID=768198 RepID=A0ABS9E3Y0_9PROT|nr:MULTISPECIES: methionine--tRNA ligase [Acidiphilium]MCF3948626.1 methionine--tRNA ligase [Acidiphilium iwatense]MCU4161381.1 methionine--tRNA ligase [Acidiphilium sp. AL]